MKRIITLATATVVIAIPSVASANEPPEVDPGSGFDPEINVDLDETVPGDQFIEFVPGDQFIIGENGVGGGMFLGEALQPGQPVYGNITDSKVFLIADLSTVTP